MQLLPGSDDPIRIKITTCLMTELAFNALSYTRRETAEDLPIECEDYTVLVPKSLYPFLQLLRQSGHVEPLWVDAICIDQYNDREQSYLVSKLPFIYHTAQRTLCWAGLEDPSILQKITSKTSVVGNHQKSILECLSEVDILHSTYRIVENDLAVFGKGAEMFDSDIWHNVDTFLDQTYFNRYVLLCSLFFADLLGISTWKIQDIVCSRYPVIFGGKQSVPWSDLAQNLLAWLFFSPKSGPRSSATMFVLLCEAMRSTYLGLDSKHMKLPDLLLAIRSVPVRFYSFSNYARLAYSIATLKSPDDAHELSYVRRDHLGYGQDDLAVRLNTFSSQPLSFSLTDDVDPHQPSWGANWKTPTKRFLLNHPASSFSASKRPHINQIYHRYKGSIVDVVRRTSDYLPPRRHCDHYDLSDHCLFFANWYEFATDYSARAENQLLLAYADTIQARGCGHLWEDTTITPQDRAQKARAFLDFLSNENADECDLTNSIRIFHAACFPSHDRRFAVTKKGRFCLVPKHTQDGDLVCIPYSSRVPYIFRPRMEGDGFINIGETFVHGIMHGETSEMKDCEEREFHMH